jgi:hypothetical protein
MNQFDFYWNAKASESKVFVKEDVLDSFTTLGSMAEPVETSVVNTSYMFYPYPMERMPRPAIFIDRPPSPPSSPQSGNVEKLSASQKKKIRESARNLVCHNCQTSKTPLWRRSSCKKFNLCNACGLYEKQYGEQRPVSYVHKQQRASRSQNRVAPSKGLEALIEMVSKGDIPRHGTITLNWTQLEQLLKMAKSSTII